MGASRGAFADPGDGRWYGTIKASWELESEMPRRPEVKCATSGPNAGDRRSEAAVQILVRVKGRQTVLPTDMPSPTQAFLVRKLIINSPLLNQ